ncbi:MAG TPA: M48 family metalloprotease [Burkholderiaceae bacterium]|nr:M48 family metalloprotease [Burkholderiaceae bacterium]
MNFFEQQDQARRQTRTLIILFVLAVIAIVIAVNAAMALVWIWAKAGHLTGGRPYPRGFFATNTLITLGLIAGGTLIETFNLRDGGDAVARMAGGRLVPPSSQELRERRLLNVVEEMALASGIACPKVYVLDREDSINAFAAGYNPNEAVVAVTRGTLERLTRDELQGVIGHEFSHILNGDMRLNVRLIGVLFGIQMIAGFGQHLMDFGSRSWSGRSRDRGGKGPSAQLVLLATGVALFAIGYIGIFFGRLIKSAVSRQREFLADASAVQFTRNPDGIGGALRKIGGLSRSMELGSRINHPNAEQLSHIFLGAVKPKLMAGLLATHPPVEERLRRIYGREMAFAEAPEIREAAPPTASLPDIPYAASGFAAEPVAAPVHASALVFGSSADAQVPLPPQLDSAVHDPQAAPAVVYALLLGQETERSAQMAVLAAEPRQQELVSYLAQAVAQLPKSARLPLLDLAMPALKLLPQQARDGVLATADKLIAADNRMTLAEFVLQTVLARRLDARAGRSTPIRFSRLAELKPESAVLLSLTAHVAAKALHETPSEAFARGVASCPELGLPASGLIGISELGFEQVRRTLDRVNQLAPLAKPALIKALLAVAGGDAAMPIEIADLLRAICAALEAPIPPDVAATYTACRWGELA